MQNIAHILKDHTLLHLYVSSKDKSTIFKVHEGGRSGFCALDRRERRCVARGCWQLVIPTRKSGPMTTRRSDPAQRIVSNSSVMSIERFLCVGPIRKCPRAKTMNTNSMCSLSSVCKMFRHGQQRSCSSLLRLPQNPAARPAG